MLNTRERQILALLVARASNKEIAYQLALSENTVEKYLSILYRKLGARDRAEATLWYENMLKRERQSSDSS